MPSWQGWVPCCNFKGCILLTCNFSIATLHSVFLTGNWFILEFGCMQHLHNDRPGLDLCRYTFRLYSCFLYLNNIWSTFLAVWCLRLSVGKLKLKPLQWRARQKNYCNGSKGQTIQERLCMYIFWWILILFETTMCIYQFSVSPPYVHNSQYCILKQ